MQSGAVFECLISVNMYSTALGRRIAFSPHSLVVKQTAVRENPSSITAVDELVFQTATVGLVRDMQ